MFPPFDEGKLLFKIFTAAVDYPKNVIVSLGVLSDGKFCNNMVGTTVHFIRRH